MKQRMHEKGSPKRAFRAEKREPRAGLRPAKGRRLDGDHIFSQNMIFGTHPATKITIISSGTP